ncbi:hypothetical protein ACSHT0_02195 [Tepidicaulis sp. LMO-SS28]|uniref:hypothetical protein n=1 Tax=Tepidicaulis sp. LMO-SS28 TaxID=3447455 RepID=UPI003EDEAA48
MAFVRINGHRYPVPGSPIIRVVLGLVLIGGGFLGFLPILGFWMLPLGLVILSVDFAPVRRLRRRAEVWWGRRRQRKRRAAASSRSE